MALKSRSHLQSLPREELKAYLDDLSRPQLQALAKRDGVKASGKSVVIAGRLIKQYAKESTPSAPEVSPSAVAADPQAIEEKRELLPASYSPSPSPHTTPAKTGSTPHDAPSNAEATEPPLKKAKKGPTYREVRGIRQRLTEQTNSDYDLRRHVADSETILAKIHESLFQSTDDLNETVCLRAAMETQLLSRWRSNPSYWDGTGVYPPGDNKDKWDAWKAMLRVEAEVEDDREAEQLEADVQRILAENREIELRNKRAKRELALAKKEKERKKAEAEAQAQQEDETTQSENAGESSKTRKRAHEDIDA